MLRIYSKARNRRFEENMEKREQLVLEKIEDDIYMDSTGRKYKLEEI